MVRKQINLDSIVTKHRRSVGEYSCLFCGKEIKKQEYFVHLLTNGCLINTDQEVAGSQGFFPIGSECKKKIPSDFYFKK